MTSLSDRPFREAAQRALLAAAERLEALPPDTDLRPRLSVEHVLTFARLVEAPVSWVGRVRADQLAAYLRDAAAAAEIPADVLNLAASSSPEVDGCPYECERARPWDLECPDCGAEMEPVPVDDEG